MLLSHLILCNLQNTTLQNRSKKKTTSNLNIASPFCIKRQILKKWFATIHHCFTMNCCIYVICWTPVFRIYWKYQLSEILRWGNILINKTKQKMIQNIFCARYFRWLIIFVHYLQKSNLQNMPKNSILCNDQIEVCLDQQESPQKLFKLLNNW